MSRLIGAVALVTGGSRGIGAATADVFASEVRQQHIDRTPLGRLATPQDVGRAVLSVVTDLTATTGAVVPVDGGRPLG